MCGLPESMPLTSDTELRSKAAVPAATLKTISIVVACRNEEEHIRAFVDSLLAQNLSGFDSEIIIADGDSDDGTRPTLAELSRKFPQIKVINNPSRIVSTGLNAAIRSARGEIILRMDATLNTTKIM